MAILLNKRRVHGSKIRNMSIVHNYAVIKMIPGGLSENRLSGLMRAFGLDVVFINNLVDAHRIFLTNLNDKAGVLQTGTKSLTTISGTSNFHEIERIDNTDKESVAQSIEDLSHPLLTLMDMIETRLAERQCPSSQINPTNSKIIRCSASNATSPLLSSDIIKSATVKKIECSACQQKVPDTKVDLRGHTQTHAGKRYQCSACSYLTDRKFDFNRHVRRRHKEDAARLIDRVAEGGVSHWATVFRTCFPRRGHLARVRKLIRPNTGSRNLIKNPECKSIKSDHLK